jgi:hypothetical protein
MGYTLGVSKIDPEGAPDPVSRETDPPFPWRRLLAIEDELEAQHTDQRVVFAITAALGIALVLLLKRVKALEAPVG